MYFLIYKKNIVILIFLFKKKRKVIQKKIKI